MPDIVATIFIRYLVQLVVLSLGTTIGTTAYQTIRTAKEGPAAETLAEVFA